ncbi:MAG: Bacterial extracellular solute-binding proteins, family 5 Middle [Methanocella sp. PtaU1.Bin125]|nr:MAG: Bacterial extracellular solute-binding proteins, family 5 Middle [Methanocella sp. PtaU1.Bin125]
MDKRFASAIFVVAVLVMAFVLIAGCTSPTPAPTKSFTLVEMTISDPPSLDPGLEYDTACYSNTQNVYETLVWYEGPDVSKPIGLLATSWEHNADFTVWTFKLRPNVTFHDGSAFNASSVKYTFDRGVLMNYPDGPWVGAGISGLLKGGDDWMNSNNTEADAQAYLANEAVKVIDDLTVQFTLSRSYPDWYHVCAFPATAIVSQVFEQSNMPYKYNNWTDTYLKEHMSGTGPFKFVSWAHEDNIQFVRNENYWKTPAKAERVVVRTVPDVNSRVLAFDKGECDISQENLRNLPVFRNSTGADFKIYNDTLIISFIGMYQGNAPFDNVKVRQAFVESFDYETYRTQVGYGYGAFMHGVVPRGLAGFNENIPVLTYNPEHAKQLLQEAGFNKSNPQTIVISFNQGNTGRQTGCLMLKDTVEKYDLGITLDIQELTWATLLDKQKKGELDMFFLGWQADFPTTDNFIGPVLISDVYFAKQVKYKNATIDDLYYNQYFTAKSDAERKQISDQIQMGYLADYPYIVYLQPAAGYAVSKNIKGYQWNVMQSGFMWYDLYK